MGNCTNDHIASRPQTNRQKNKINSEKSQQKYRIGTIRNKLLFKNELLHASFDMFFLYDNVSLLCFEITC